jgi:hypothetical protein
MGSLGFRVWELGSRIYDLRYKVHESISLRTRVLVLE